MAATDRSRGFDRLRMTSDLPRGADIVRQARHVRKVPNPEIVSPAWGTACRGCNERSVLTGSYVPNSTRVKSRLANSGTGIDHLRAVFNQRSGFSGRRRGLAGAKWHQHRHEARGSMGSIVLLDLMGGVALLMWGLHMVRSGIMRAFGSELRRVLG
jgi:hypothetical protein